MPARRADEYPQGAGRICNDPSSRTAALGIGPYKVYRRSVSYTHLIEVDCANCANLMEEAANKTEGVASATVNFMTQKMIVEFSEGADEKKTMKAVLKACKKVEPDCEIEL